MAKPQSNPPFKAAEPKPVDEIGAPKEPAGHPGLPTGFEPIDTAVKDGRTLKLWFGTSDEEMTDKYFVLARWRRTTKMVNRRWVKTGMWCHPHSNLQIGFEFKAWQAVGQVSQQEIDISNAAVHAENLRRAEAAKAKMRKPDSEEARA